MPQPRLKKIITELPFEKKLISSGALLLIISLFLPWYQDIDSFHTGQAFTGLSGPLYLIGFTFFLVSCLSLAFVVMDYFNKRISFFNLKSSKLYFGFGIFSFYLLFVVNSIYFDGNFGINVADKQSQYGMFIAFIATALFTIGGYMSLRERKAILREFEEETRDPLIVSPKMETPIPRVQQQKPRENLRTIYPNTPQPTKNPEPRNVPEKPAKAPQPFRMDL